MVVLASIRRMPSVETAGAKEWIARLFLEAVRRAARRLSRPSETKPREPEVAKPEAVPDLPAAEQGISVQKPSDFVGQEFGKLGVGSGQPRTRNSPT